MEKACPNCGNRQHAPGSRVCRNCGALLSDMLDELMPETQITQQNDNENIPVEILSSPTSPCLQDRNNRILEINRTGETLVGSHPQMDIRLFGPGIVTRHARIFFTGGEFFIESLTMGIIYVNGSAVVNYERRIRNHDIIKFGSSLEFIFLEARPREVEIISSPKAEPQYYENDSRMNILSPNENLTRRPENCDLYGRVVLVEGPISQMPDRTTGKMVGDAAKFLLAIWKPATVILHKPQQPNQVRLIRVETSNGEQRLVIMIGGYSSGVIQMGDEVAFWGRWDGGTLVMSHAFNYSLNTRVTIQK